VPGDDFRVGKVYDFLVASSWIQAGPSPTLPTTGTSTAPSEADEQATTATDSDTTTTTHTMIKMETE